MRRTNIVALAPSTAQHKKLLELADYCSRLWNELSYRRRQSYFGGYINWNFKDLYDKYKGIVGSATAQQIERKNSEAWRSFFALLSRKRADRLPANIASVKPPGYWKDRRTNTRKLLILIRCDCYRFEEKILRLPKKLDIRWKGHPNWARWIRQGLLTLIYDKVNTKWYAHQSVEVEIPHQPLSDKRAYVDLGVINLLTIAIDDKRKTLAYSGRPALADWWYISRRINKLKALAKSMNNKESTKQIRRLFRIRRKRFQHYVCTMVYRAVRELWHNGVSTIVLGDLTGILENARGRRRTNTMTHNFWSHRFLVQRILNQAEEFGINVELVDERGTSSSCLRCNSQQVIRRGRLLACRACGLEAHRDTVGAVNIGVVFGGRVNGVMAHPLEISV